MRDIIVLTSGVLILALGVFLVAGAAKGGGSGALWADTADGGWFARRERGMYQHYISGSDDYQACDIDTEYPEN